MVESVAQASRRVFRDTKVRRITMNLPAVFLSIATWSAAFALPFAGLVAWDARKSGVKLPK